MNGFLYFLPVDRPVVTEPLMKAAGVGHAWDGQNGMTSRGLRPGPGDTNGMLAFSNAITDAVAEYRPAEQTWRKGNGGAYWVGFWNDRVPGPADLARKRVYAGESLTLGDGKLWTIPRCHGWLPGRPSVLPGYIDASEDGQTMILGNLLPEFEEVASDAQRVAAVWSNQPDRVELTAADEIRICMSALKVNYRVGPIEIVLLKLIRTDQLRDILLATCDGLEAEKRMKAKEAREAAGQAQG